jgi:hypothetical protein
MLESMRTSRRPAAWPQMRRSSTVSRDRVRYAPVPAEFPPPTTPRLESRNAAGSPSQVALRALASLSGWLLRSSCSG